MNYLYRIRVIAKSMSKEAISMNLTPLSPRSIQELETQILAEAKAECKKAFGDRKVTIFDNDPLYEIVLNRLEHLTKRFPLTANKKKLIGSSCIVTPKLLVGFSVFEKLIEERVKGNMLEVDFGKKIAFGPLLDPVLGYITTEDIELKVRNIRVFKDGKLVDNVFTEEFLQQETEKRKCILLNEDVNCGYVDTNPNIQKTQILADVEFGDFKEKDQLIDVQTEGDESTTYLCFKLPPIEGKISYTGSVTLTSEKLTKYLDFVKLEELVGLVPNLCIDHIFNVDAPFFPSE